MTIRAKGEQLQKPTKLHSFFVHCSEWVGLRLAWLALVHRMSQYHSRLFTRQWNEQTLLYILGNGYPCYHLRPQLQW